MQQIEGWLLLLYAASLPLSMTASWILYIAGLSVTILLRILGKRADPSIPDGRTTFNDLLQAPLTIPLLIFTLVVFVSGLLNGGIKEGFQSIWSLKPLAVYFWADWAWLLPVALAAAAIVLK